VTKLDLDTETDGDHATVRLKGFAAKAASESESIELSYDGKCTTVVNNGKSDSFCAGSLDDTNLKDTLGTEEDLDVPQDLVDVSKKLRGFEPGIAAVRRDGKWYVSPETTLTDLVFGVLERLDSGDIKKITNGIGDFADELFGQMFGSQEFNSVGSAIGSDTTGGGIGGPDSSEFVLPPGVVPTRDQLMSMLKASPLSVGTDSGCLADKILATHHGAELRQFYDALLGVSPSSTAFREYFELVGQCPG